MSKALGAREKPTRVKFDDGGEEGKSSGFDARGRLLTPALAVYRSPFECHALPRTFNCWRRRCVCVLWLRWSIHRWWD